MLCVEKSPSFSDVFTEQGEQRVPKTKQSFHHHLCKRDCRERRCRMKGEHYLDTLCSAEEDKAEMKNKSKDIKADVT